MRELGVFGSTRSANPTYERIKLKAEAIVKRHKAYLKKKLNLNDIPEDLPFIYWIPKLHKKPFSKQRFISASYKCSTKPLSALLTKCYSLIKKTHKQASNRYYQSYGINPMWIIDSSSEVQKIIAPNNRKKETKNVRTYDFSTLYTNIPHKLLKKEMAWVIKESFRLSKKKIINVGSTQANWSVKPGKNTVDEKNLIHLTN